MAKRSTHCDLCPQVKPRLTAAEIIVTVDGYEYPVSVCDRHRAVLKNMFLGVIPASAFGDVAAKPITRKVTASKSGKVAKTTAAKKSTAAKKATAKKSTAKKVSAATARKAAKKVPRTRKTARG